MMGRKYYRKDKTVYSRENNRDLPIVTCQSLLGAALTVRQLVLTDGGKKGDWRKYIKYNRRGEGYESAT